VTGHRDHAVQVVVVGAGLAGLTAAFDLLRAGISVHVLEAGAAPGGRVTTEFVSGWPMEQGAQFLSTAYRTVTTLIRDLGLRGALRRTSGRTLVLAADGEYAFDVRNPLSLLTSGVVPVRQAPAVLRHARRLARALPPDDLGAWTALDSTRATEWTARHLPEVVVDRLLRPAVHGFYFQALEGNGAALPAALLSMYGRGGSVVTLRGGLGTLTAALAARVPVSYRTPATAIEVGDAGVLVRTHDRRISASAVVLAVDAAAARPLLPTPGALADRLLATPYSPGLLVGWDTADRLPRTALQGAYGVLTSPGARPGLAALAVASRAGGSDGRDGDLVTAMLDPATAVRLRDAADGQVAVAVGTLLRDHLPCLAHGARAPRVVRWTQAMPTVPVGQADAVREYRATLPRRARVVLAGDYLGFPWTDSAAFNGRWAARHLRDALASGALTADRTAPPRGGR